MSRKPARKPAKKSSVQLRAAQAAFYLAALEGDLESAENALFGLAWDEVELALRRGAIKELRCDNSLRFEVGNVELGEIILSIALATVRFCVTHWRDGIETLAVNAMRDAKIAEQRTENGELLAAEGRAAKKTADDRRANRICKLYRRIRERHPAGKRGNGATLEAVSRQFGPLPGRDKPITVHAIRKALKRCGVPCR